MATPHPILTLAVVFAGSFAGGAVVTSQRPAQAQDQPANVQSIDVIRVPNGGLAIRTMDNRLIGRIAERDGNGELALFSSNGRPSVAMLAGPDGLVTFEGTGGGRLRIQSGRKSVMMSASADVALVSVNSALNLFSFDQEANLILESKQAGKSMSLVAAPAGVEISAKGTRDLFKLGGTDSARIALFDAKGSVGFLGAGSGRAMVRAEDKVIWQVPEED